MKNLPYSLLFKITCEKKNFLKNPFWLLLGEKNIYDLHEDCFKKMGKRNEMAAGHTY